VPELTTCEEVPSIPPYVFVARLKYRYTFNCFNLFFYFHIVSVVSNVVLLIIILYNIHTSLHYNTRHELFSPAPTLRSWVRIPLRHGCLCVFCMRFFCFYLVSSETASRPNKRLSLDKPLQVRYTVCKLAYRI
jgi:hypothetical protein